MELLNSDRHGAWSFLQDACQTCGYCSSVCPVAGIDDFDPRKLVRMVNLGFEQEIIEARWPWVCTMCAKCEDQCPMNVDIAEMVKQIRSMRDRDKVPGVLHKGIEAATESGNNLRLPKEDFVFVLEDVAEELAEEPGFEGFTVPIDKEDANILNTVHNKLVNTHTDDLKHWWKIFHAAKESWTIPSDNWEGTNWGTFTGDENAMKMMTGRIVENMKRLRAKNLLWPE